MVSIISRGQNLEGNTNNLLPPGSKTGADIDRNYGGGVNIPYGKNGSLSIILSNSTAPIPDYINGSGHPAVSNSSAGELIAHEMLGHGVGRTSGSLSFGHNDAIQMTNMYRRSQGSNLYRNGTTHGTGVLLNPTQASGTPSMYQTDIEGGCIATVCYGIY